MSVFRPGNIEIDEHSESGYARHGDPHIPPDWPDPERWKQVVENWLRRINRDHQSQVAQWVLNELELPPASGQRPGVHLHRHCRRREAWTIGPLPPTPPRNPTGQTAIFITYSPDDSYTSEDGPLPVYFLAPKDYPPSVLLHELVHVLMAIHGLDTVAHAGQWRPTDEIWAIYPSQNEFLATTIQNMMLSEAGVVLADGYSRGANDPTIESAPLMPEQVRPLGRAARTRTDLARFVRDYLQPLVFLQSHMSDFTRRLADFDHIPFNPFRELRRQQRLLGGHIAPPLHGAARRPGPIRQGDRRR